MKFKSRSKKCPVCSENARKTEAQYDPKAYLGFEHWCCDKCKIGWYDKPGARGKIIGTRESMRENYVTPRPRQGKNLEADKADRRKELYGQD